MVMLAAVGVCATNGMRITNDVCDSVGDSARDPSEW
jgi:hypothetical protein